jgi:hypothetical protein
LGPQRELKPDVSLAATEVIDRAQLCLKMEELAPVPFALQQENTA